MLLKSSLSFATHSGLVAFDGGGAADVDAYLSPKARQALQPALPVPMSLPMPVPAVEAGVDGMRQSATWQPATAARNRLVEGSVIIAICAYFVFGAASLLHWI